jgi:hypothetical protein
MNEVLKESLMKKQLLAFIKDTLGSAPFGPALKTQTNDVVVIGDAEYHIDDLMKRCNDDKEIKDMIAQLVDYIGKASPHKLYRHQKASLLAKMWNGMTGAADTEKVEFKLYCRKVEAIAKVAPEILDQAENTIPLIDTLLTLYQRDVALLEQHIETGELFIEGFNGEEALQSQTAFGLDRLRRKIVNMKVTKATLEMHCSSVGLALEASVGHVDRARECLNDVLPMWRTMVRMFNAGVYDINIDTETQKRFEALVNRMNAMKGKH